MTRRERLEAKLEKRLGWAEGRKADAARRFEGVRRIADNIPLGQPILIGHHSERHARKDQERIHNGMSKGIESEKMAEHHISKAGGIERQLEGSIFSDDPDALEALEARIKELEEKREEKRLLGAAWRKAKRPKSTDVEGWKKVSTILGWAWGHVSILRAMRDCASEEGFCNRGPVPSYVLSNLGGNITRLRKRIEEVKRRKVITEAAEVAPSGVLIQGTGEYVRVTFAEKPSRATIDALKLAGFRWGAGSWTGRREALPVIPETGAPAPES